MKYDTIDLQISRELADSIVSEIGTTVNKNINIMNSEGIIIASSDATRVGQLHEIAFQIIREDLDELYIDPKDDTTLMKAGLNMPIIVFNRKIGVLGITGPYNEVNILGPVLKKATEIFVTTEMNKNFQIQDIRIKENIIKRWLFSESSLNKDIVLFQQIKLLNIKNWQQYRICTISYPDREQLGQTQDGLSVLNSADLLIRNYFRFNLDTVILKENNEFIIFFFGQSQKKILNNIDTICQKIEKQLKIKLSVGLDALQPTDRPLDSYHQAVLAMKTAEKRKQNLILYDDLDLEIFLDYVPYDVKLGYLRKIFKTDNLSELTETFLLLKNHFQNNGSIKKTAEDMFLHPNTIQYRLKRIYEDTEFDPRTLQAAALFGIAIAIFEDMSL